MSLKIDLFQKEEEEEEEEKAHWNATTNPWDSGICVDMPLIFMLRNCKSICGMCRICETFDKLAVDF
jgi:hypothetical protein